MELPSAKEIGNALTTVAWGPTVDPGSLAKAGGPESPVDESWLQVALSQPAKAGSYAKSYEDWAAQHPIYSTAADLGAQFVISELPWTRALRSLPHGGKIADIIKIAEEAGGGLHDWAGGAQATKSRPRGLEANESRDWYEFDRPYNISEKGDKEVTHMLDIYRKGSDELVGTVIAHPEKDFKNLHISAVSGEHEGEPSENMLRHAINMKEDLVQHYPKLETISYTDKSGRDKVFPLDITPEERGQGYPLGLSREMEKQLDDWWDHLGTWGKFKMEIPADFTHYSRSGEFKGYDIMQPQEEK